MPDGVRQDRLLSTAAPEREETEAMIRTGDVLHNPVTGELVVIANAHFDDVRLAFPSAWMQKTGLVLGSAVGSLLGFEPTYEPAAAALPSLAL
jgi:hypothetical protein